jgi:anti-sigma B factor antagonist
MPTSVPDLPNLAGEPPFACETTIDADAVRLVLHGELDMASTPRFDEHAATALATADLPIVVDLRGLSFIDSSGIRALLRLHAGARTQISFIPGPAPVQRVFELASLTAVLPFSQ